MPNIDDTIAVQLDGDVALQEDGIMTKQLDSIIIASEEDRVIAEERLVDTSRTDRRAVHIDASKEVRSLLEFLFLDVKVRSPAEIQDLTDAKLMEERANLTKVTTIQLIKDIR